MKVKTLIRFTDLKENTIREVGEVFEVSKVRFAEISALSPKTLIEEAVEGPATEEVEEKIEKEVEEKVEKKKVKKPSKKAGD